ncbi:MAG: 50S ribosomal protein L6 [Proteobacteria bacterium]|nr:50S ribosomal protein L6 [Pseudomonadota bacterium]
MSRIGKRPVVVPKGVTANMSGTLLTAKSPKGELSFDIKPDRFPGVAVELKDGAVTVTRRDDGVQGRREQGLVRALVQNIMTGLSDGFTKELEIIGVGYKAEVKGKVLALNLGYSHPIDFEIPAGIKIDVDKQTRVKITGADRHLVGEVAAQIRRMRPPEPYKGKGIKYAGEYVRRKVGKAAAGATGG